MRCKPVEVARGTVEDGPAPHHPPDPGGRWGTGRPRGAPGDSETPGRPGGLGDLWEQLFFLDQWRAADCGTGSAVRNQTERLLSRGSFVSLLPSTGRKLEVQQQVNAVKERDAVVDYCLKVIHLLFESCFQGQELMGGKGRGTSPSLKGSSLICIHLCINTNPVVLLNDRSSLPHFSLRRESSAFL